MRQFALLTEQPDGSFDLPRRWTGSRVTAELQGFFEDINLAAGLFRDPFTDADRAVFGLFPVLPPPPPAPGELHAPAADAFAGAAVQETVTVTADPDYVAPDPAAEALARCKAAVKAEAMRRILEVVPEWKQRNLMAHGLKLQDKGRTNWTAEDLALWEAGEAIWAEVDAIRAKSDAIEADLGDLDLGGRLAFIATDPEIWL